MNNIDMNNTSESTGERIQRRIEEHQDSMQQKLDHHVARSQERLDSAVDKTSEVIGKAGSFVKEHTPEAIGNRVQSLTDRARDGLDRSTDSDN